MNDTIIVAILSLVGTAIGSVASIFASMKVTNLKIDNLQKEVEKHNKIVERTFRLEEHAAVIDVQIDAAEQRIFALEKKVGDNHG